MDLKHRKKRFLFWLAALSAAALLSGCKAADSADTGVSEKAFGVDYMQELSVENAEQIVCTQTDTWIVTTAKNDFIYRVDHTQETERIEKVEWQQQEGEILLNLMERSGTLYISVRLAEEDIIEVRKRYTGGSFQTIMQTEITDTGWCVVGSGLFVDSDGKIYLAGQNSITRFAKEGTLDCEYKVGAGGGFFTENSESTESPSEVEYVAAEAGGITLYDLSGEKAEKKWTLKSSAAQICGIQNSDNDTLCLSTRDKLLFIDRESGSLLAQSELVMMGMLSVRAGICDAEEETLRLCGESGGSPGKLSLGQYSKRDASAEQRTELVFGTLGQVNNNASDRIQKAIMEFNQKNTRYYITIRNYAGDYDMERLHADMAAGSAPDLIEFSSLSSIWRHYETDVKNGYLENLYPYLTQSEYNDDIVWNVLSTYEIDNGLYMLMPQFDINGLLLHPDCSIPAEWNMETFLDLIRQNQWEKDIICPVAAGDPGSLLYNILIGAKEDFINWEQNTAAFETEEFLNLLILCKEYGEQDWPDKSGWSWNEICRNTLYMYSSFSRFSSYLAETNVYGREYPIYGFPTSSGQVYEIEPSSDGCAIYAGSKNKEGAWEFLESLLAESHQKWIGGANAGFPIRKSVLEEMAAEAKDITYGPSGNTIKFTDKELSILEDIIYNGSFVRGRLNENIQEIIQEEAASYFAGDKSAEETAHIIQSRVELILNE